MDAKRPDWIRQRIAETASAPIPEKIKIIADTTEFMNICRGHVLTLGARYLLVTGNIYESCFGLSSEPKYWVKKVVDLESGIQQIIKMAYEEEFQTNIGRFKIRCHRNPHKEALVLELVRGNDHFMQGQALFDQHGNEVRAVDYIRGNCLHDLILGMRLSHEDYFHNELPQILRKLRNCFEAVRLLHDNGLCHGEIRSDHILIERDTGKFRWIDFDLTQEFSDYDVWSMGNVLQLCVGMGTVTFHEVFNSTVFPEAVKRGMSDDDASAFFENRIVNLQKLFPYIPDQLNDILLRFSSNTRWFYESVGQLIVDIDGALEYLPGSSEEMFN
jgi:tRNA A-37 threonylcarbamoyl transferase component Bud32